MLRINQYWLSKIFWDTTLESLGLLPKQDVEELLMLSTELESLRVKAKYNTGSVSQASMLLYAAVAAMTSPRDILEVGTFIGKSTMAMAIGAREKHRLVNVYTCDYSNDITLPALEGVNLIQYKLQTSTKMLTDYLKLSAAPGLVHLDGRVTREDVDLLSRLHLANTTFLLDDFEGTEKGVLNAMLLQSLVGKTHALIYPIEDRTVRIGSQLVRGRSSLACIYPRSLINLTAQ